MARKFSGDVLILASHNPGKVREITALLEPRGIAVKSAAELGLPEPAETGTTFAANAELKARSAVTGAGGIALADDSGLVVPALDGAPGILSARWAGPDGDFQVAMARVWAALEARDGHQSIPRETHRPSHRSAYFVCALVLAWPDGHVERVEGRVDGNLVWPPRGGRGFGYDPMFVPAGHDITFGEMDPDAKHAISHRADAFRKLVDACFDP